ncbi:NUDIX hydrolase [Pseudactinotalea terrae]|uniref:NUDIX hydrolase n=1 Tax=Pseudactinotalea terrae TaxID=1743262 RepID=UPI0012E23DBC|nr:NUDIX domain-containing protein [Pseudactinotalea terrae]
MGESPEVAVSTVIFALRNEDPRSAEPPTLSLPLVFRTREPFDGRWALPGGPLGDETLQDAARRTLAATTGLEPAYLEQMYTFGDPGRSPDGRRVVSVVYWALVRADEVAHARPQQNVRWLAADDLPTLAFDHNLVVEYALWRLRNKVSYGRIAHALLGETFTLRELREVHEIVRQKRLDPANFRRQVEADGAVVPTSEMRTGGAHRPARLYRYNTEVEPVDLGPIAQPTRSDT